MTDDTPPMPDPWFWKTITHRANGRVLRFDVSQALFSSHEIDAGTRLLLRSIAASPFAGAASVLDLGCGYGAIGLTLEATHARERVHLVDRDALAVAYASRNAALNGAENVLAYGSLGYDDVSSQFNLIAMNIPGKAGEAVIRHLLRGAHRCLSPAGVVAAVGVAPLAALIASVLREEPAIEVLYEASSKDYVVVHYRFSAAPGAPEPVDAFDAGVYSRANPRVHAGVESFDLTTSHGLPEFDQPSYATQLLLGELASVRPPQRVRAAVLNPGQGNAAVLLDRVAAPRRITLVGRDLLSLRVTAANLAANGRTGSTELIHESGFPEQVAENDVILAAIDDADPIEVSARVLAEAITTLAADGVMLVATTSTTAGRLKKRIGAVTGVRVSERVRRHGAALLRVTRG